MAVSVTDVQKGRSFRIFCAQTLDTIPFENSCSLDLSDIGTPADTVEGVDLAALSASAGSSTFFSAGEEVHLTDGSATDHVWHRNLENDLSPADRLDQQKQFMTEFNTKALEESTGNPLKRLRRGAFSTNLGTSEVAYLASNPTEHNISSLDTASILGELAPVPDRPAVFIPNEEGIQQLDLGIFYLKRLKQRNEGYRITNHVRISLALCR